MGRNKCRKFGKFSLCPVLPCDYILCFLRFCIQIRLSSPIQRECEFPLLVCDSFKRRKQASIWETRTSSKVILRVTRERVVPSSLVKGTHNWYLRWAWGSIGIGVFGHRSIFVFVWTFYEKLRYERSAQWMMFKNFGKLQCAAPSLKDEVRTRTLSDYRMRMERCVLNDKTSFHTILIL